MKNYFSTVLSVLLIIFSLSLELKAEIKWATISGNWVNRKDLKESFIIETVNKPLNLGYSYLINNNSLITREPINGYTNISLNLFIGKTKINDSFCNIFFSEKSQKEFYSFQFEGNVDKIHRLVLIKSAIKDTTLPSMAKWNFTITELASETVDLPYDKKMDVKIETDEKRITLYVDGKKILKYKADDRVDSGRIGFSNRNARPRIYGVKVMNGKEVVFEDDFKEDSISRFIMKRKPAK